LSAQPKQQFEGPALEPLLERIHDEVGPTARIVRAERSRQGGVMGFFAHQHYRLEVQPPADRADDGAGAAALGAKAPATADTEPGPAPSGPAPIDAFASLAEATLDVTELSSPEAPPGRPARRRAGPTVPPPLRGDIVEAAGTPKNFDSVLRRVASGLDEPSPSDETSLPAPAALGVTSAARADIDVAELDDEVELDAPDDRFDVDDDRFDVDDDFDGEDGVDGDDRFDVDDDFDDVDVDDDPNDFDDVDVDDDPNDIDDIDPVHDEVMAFRDELDAFVLPDGNDGTPPSGSEASPDPAVEPHDGVGRRRDDRYREEPSRWSFPPPVALPPLALPPAVVAAAPVPVRAGEAAPRPAPTAEPAVLARLADVGLGPVLLDLVRTGLAAGDGLEDALFAALAQLPTAPPLPFRRGSLLAVVGDHDAAWPVASELADEIGAPAVAFAALGAGGRHLNSELVARSAGEAAEKAPGWRRSAVAVVCVDAPVDLQSLQWSGSVLHAVRPTAVWGVVDATAKPEDVDAWAHAVGGVDALVVRGAGRTVSPAAVLRAGIPVARVDDFRASAHRWAALIRERVMTWG
jgi:hypothetical protein